MYSLILLKSLLEFLKISEMAEVFVEVEKLYLLKRELWYNKASYL